MHDKLLLTVAEVATELSISKSKAYQMVRRRQLPCVRLGGAIRIPKKALERLLQESTVPAATKVSAPSLNS
jgi:excisionase family DNA binding protein